MSVKYLNTHCINDLQVIIIANRILIEYASDHLLNNFTSLFLNDSSHLRNLSSVTTEIHKIMHFDRNQILHFSVFD